MVINVALPFTVNGVGFTSLYFAQEYAKVQAVLQKRDTYVMHKPDIMTRAYVIFTAKVTA